MTFTAKFSCQTERACWSLRRDHKLTVVAAPKEKVETKYKENVSMTNMDYFITHLQTGNFRGRNHSLMLNNLVDEPIAERLVRRHIEVTIGVDAQLLDGLARELGQISVEHILGVQDELCGDLQVDGFTLGASERLVNHDARVGQRSNMQE